MSVTIDPKERNETIFKELIKALSSDDEQTFLRGAKKIIPWVSNARAYYPEMKPTILRTLEAARATLTRLCNCSTDFTITMDIPSEFSARKEAYVRLVGTVVHFVKHFYCGEDAESLGPRIDALFHSIKGSNDWIESTERLRVTDTSVPVASSSNGTPQPASSQMQSSDAQRGVRSKLGAQIEHLPADTIDPHNLDEARTSITMTNDSNTVHVESPVTVDSLKDQNTASRVDDLLHPSPRKGRPTDENSAISELTPMCHKATQGAQQVVMNPDSSAQIPGVSGWAPANNKPFEILDNSHLMNPPALSPVLLPLTAHSLSLHDASQRRPSSPAQLAGIKRTAPSTRSPSPATIPTPMTELRARKSSLNQGFIMRRESQSRQMSPMGGAGLTSTSPAVPSPLSAIAGHSTAPISNPLTLPIAPQATKDEVLLSGPAVMSNSRHNRKVSVSSSVSEAPGVSSPQNDSQSLNTDSRPRKRPKFSLPRKVSGPNPTTVQAQDVEQKHQLASWEKADLEWYSISHQTTEIVEQVSVESPGRLQEQQYVSSFDVNDANDGGTEQAIPLTSDKGPLLKSDVLESKYTPLNTRLLAICHGVPVGEEFAIRFEVPESFSNHSTNWKNRFEPKSDVSGSMCLSLVCYSTETKIDLSADFEKIKMQLMQNKPSWPENSCLYAQIEESHILLAPPLHMSDDKFVDITKFVRQHANIVFKHYTDMSNYTFAVYEHPPTPSQISEYQKRRDADLDWSNFLKDFSKPFYLSAEVH